MPIPKQTIKDRLNKRNSPNDKTIKLGDLLDDLITKHNAMLAKLDAANLAGMGTNNVATLSVTALDKRQ